MKQTNKQTKGGTERWIGWGSEGKKLRKGLDYWRRGRRRRQGEPWVDGLWSGRRGRAWHRWATPRQPPPASAAAPEMAPPPCICKGYHPPHTPHTSEPKVPFSTNIYMLLQFWYQLFSALLCSPDWRCDENSEWAGYVNIRLKLCMINRSSKGRKRGSTGTWKLWGCSWG